MKGGNFAESAYDASAVFGRVVAFFQMLGGVIFGIVFVLVGIAALRSKPDPQQPKSNNILAGVIFILIGIFLFFGTILWFIATLKYKAVAAGTGAVTAVGWTANAIFDQ